MTILLDKNLECLENAKNNSYHKNFFPNINKI